ncbi:hypothetical protein DID78_05790 [Candidatus Marinamargulisbacteria bacterium SCGC AG-343-D04]|nr:hypothetical protein DID78_05790 [Candidatus Marinamargulisbacteria bacterium SCGC AG-343-D04]
MIRVVLVLLVLSYSMELSAAPLWLAGLTNKLVTLGQSSKEKMQQMKHFARMTSLLHELKLVNEQQNQDIQKLSNEYKKITHGHYYKSATQLLYTKDTKNTHQHIQEFSKIQGYYTQKDWVTIKENDAKRKTEAFKNWLLTTDNTPTSHISSETVQKQMSADLQQIDTLNQMGREQQNNHQNTAIIQVLDNINQKQHSKELDMLEKNKQKKEKEAEQDKKRDILLKIHNSKSSKNRFEQYKRWY